MLKEILIKHENIPFRWGIHDCGLFSADVLLELKGIDYAEPVREQYNSQKEFNELLGKFDCKDYFSLVDKLTGVKRTPWEAEKVSPGNFVGIQLDEFPTSQIIGINYGDRSFFLTSKSKFLKVPIKARINKYFWSV